MKLRWNRFGKRCMALMLAVMLLAGMLPAAFAASTADPITVTKVELNTSNIDVEQDSEEQLIAKVTYSDGNVKIVDGTSSEKDVFWSSANATIASVTQKGLVTGKKAGSNTTVTVSAGSLSAKCTVSVFAKPAEVVPVTGVTVNPLFNTTNKIKVNETIALEAIVQPQDKADQSVTWKTSNSNIATVDSSGIVTGRQAGNVRITATSVSDTTKFAHCDIEVEAAAPEIIYVNRINLDPTNLSLSINDTTGQMIYADVFPNNAIPESKKVFWKTSRPYVNITPSTNGNFVTVTATSDAKIGQTATITAYTTKDGTANGEETANATCTVTLTNPITGITISGAKEIAVGDTVALSAKLDPEDAQTQTLVWSSSNTNVAKVDGDGNVTGVRDGTANITVAVQGTSIKSDPYPVTIKNVSVESFTLSQKSITVDVGATEKLTATFTPSNATNKALRWTSSNSSTAGVDAEGIVTGNASGTATITAQAVDGGTTQTCEVTVKSHDVTGIILDHAALETSVGGKIVLHPTVLPENASNKEITWESDHPEIATVKDGEITGVAKGEATITATTVDGKKTASCHITVTMTAVEITRFSLDKTSMSLDVGQTSVIETRIEPPNATNKKITWTSSDDKIAKVSDDGNGNGIVTGVSFGEVQIAATTVNGKTAHCKVNVNMAGSIQFEPELSLAPGDSKTMAVNLSAGNTISRAESENASIASVSYNGNNVTIKASGQAKVGSKVKISVYAGGKTQTCQVTISEFTLSLSSSTLTLNPNQEATLSVSGIPEGAKATAAWKNSAPTYATYSGSGTSRTIKGKSAGSTTITVTPTVNGKQYAAMTCLVTVNRPVAGTMRYRTEENEPVSFIANDFNEICISLTGKALSSVVFEQPSSNQGKLYYDYSDKNNYNQEINPSTKYKSSGSPYIHKVSFVPKNGYNGTATINYTAYSMNSETYTGKISISVGTGGDDDDYGDLEYSVDRNRTLNLSVNDFNDYCNDETGHNLDYIRFTDLPSSSRGILYYRYSSSNSRVSTGTNYYRNSSPYLDYISFEPASNYSGTVTIPFTGYSTNNNRFTGEVIIHVDDDGYRGGDVTYRTSKNRSVNFNASDFNSYCRNESGYNLNYVRFTSLPSSSRGTLYYKYSGSSSSRVSTSTNYYRSSSSYLDDITFVPASNYTGTVTIPFNAYDTNGRRISGDVVITVSSSGSDSGDISYDTAKGRSVNFSVSDFNRYSNDETGYNLNYIRFTSLPSTSRGILYYKYSNSSSTKVSTSTSYYRSSNPYIDDITFVPNDSFTGTVTIPFTAYNTNGRQVSGDVTIHVGQGSAEDISYSAQAGRTVNFSVNDFNNYARTVTGYNLDYVRFSLPSTATGTLYYQYSGSSSSRVSASTSYYRNSSPYLDEVSFVPANNSVTSAKISFTGRATDNTSFSGTVSISYDGANQNNPISGTAGTIHYASTGEPVAFQTNDFVTVCNNWGQSSLNSVRFSIPDAASGKLYSGYLSPANTGTPVNASINYMVSGSPALSSVAFVPAAGFTGTAVISYVGTDRNNRSFSGSIEVSVSRPAASAVFADVGSSYSWAASSIDYLYKSNVVSGIDANNYAPAQNISRGDFVLMLYRAFDLRTSATSSFYDVPSESYYAQAIAAAKALNIASGSTDGRFNPTDSLTRQDAMLLIQRTLNATGKSTPYGATSALGSFADGGLVAPYAQNAVAALVQSGIVSGNDHGMLNPGGTLSRAEMAIILHRVLTKL